MRTIVTVTPTVEPVTLNEAKEQLRIEQAFTEDDAYISSLISAARDRCENYCNNYFTEQSISILYQGRPETVNYFPYPNLTVTSITYTDQDNVQQTVPVSDYTVDSVNQTVTFSTIPDSINWQINADTAEPVQIVGVQQAIKIMVTDMYGLRAESVLGVSVEENKALKAMLYPYRLSLGI